MMLIRLSHVINIKRCNQSASLHANLAQILTLVKLRGESGGSGLQPY